MEKPKRTEVSIVDIAEALNISAATVSRALNNNVRISESTRQRVKDKAKEMGYRHNSMASSLRNRKSKIIGMIVPRISMYFHSYFMTALQNRVQEEGYSLIVCQSNDSIETEKQLAETLYSSRVDALVVSHTLYTESFSQFDGYVRSGIPLIFYDRVPIEPYPAHVVRGEDYRGGLISGNHLRELGCRRLAYISGPMSCILYRERTAGLEHAVEKYGLELPPEWVFHQELNVENAWTALRSIFSAKQRPDAIVAGNDTTALAAVQFAREMGIDVPGELKIIGYSNDPRASIITPPITTIDQHPEEMAKKVSNLLFGLLNMEDSLMHSLADDVVPVTLVRRMTT